VTEGDMLPKETYILYPKSPISLQKSTVVLLHGIVGGSCIVNTPVNTPVSKCLLSKETYQKRPIFDQKSPTYPQESSHPCEQLSAIKRDLFSIKRVLYIHKRAHTLSKETDLLMKRALSYIQKRAPTHTYISTRELTGVFTIELQPTIPCSNNIGLFCGDIGLFW